MSQRYCVRPSEFMHGTISDYQFDLLVAAKGQDAETKAAQKAQARARKR